MRLKLQLFLVFNIFLLSLVPNTSFAQNDSIPEEPAYIKRSFDAEKLEELASDDAFDYNRKDIDSLCLTYHKNILKINILLDKFYKLINN